MFIDLITVLFFTAICAAIWYLIHLNGFTKTTVACLFSLIVLSSALYWSLTSYRGYPVLSDISIDNEVLAILVESPSIKKEGRIYLWLKKTGNNQNHLDEILRLDYKNKPRAYQIPYTKENAKQARRAMEAKNKGYNVRVTNGRKVLGGEVSKSKFHFEVVNPREGMKK